MCLPNLLTRKSPKGERFIALLGTLNLVNINVYQLEEHKHTHIQTHH